MKVGDKVKILRQDIFPLKNRKNKNGVIKKIVGGYFYVRPMWCEWETELYFDEIELVK